MRQTLAAGVRRVTAVATVVLAIVTTAAPVSAAASLTVLPRCAGGSVTEVTLRGGGYPASTSLRVELDGVVVGSVATNASGALIEIPVPLTSPLSQQPGSHPLRVLQVSGSGEFLTVTRLATGSVAQPCIPSLLANPTRATLRPGPFALFLSGFNFGSVPFESSVSPVAFRLDGVRLPASNDAFPTERGTFGRQVTLPAMPSCGTHRITADQASENNHAQTTFVITCPTVTATPSTVAAGDLPQPIVLTGTGWDPLTDLDVTLDGVPVPGVRTDRLGRFATKAQLPVRACGTVPVTATQVPEPVVELSAAAGAGTEPAASTVITVTCPVPPVTPTPEDPPPPVVTPPPTPPTPPAPAPEPTPPATLLVDPLIMSGGVGTAHGTGFAPGRTVALTWAMPDGTTAPGTSSVVADADGRFEVQCLVLPRAMLGPRSLQAAQPTTGATRSAAATTLVVAGPMEPGRDRLLGRR